MVLSAKCKSWCVVRLYTKDGEGKMSRNKKGQGFMEWAGTYGWAILSAVIVIGVLFYFGVFSPDTYQIPEKDFCESQNYTWLDSGNGAFFRKCYNVSENNLIEEVKVICFENKCYFDKR
jgi:hypothetical protein